MTITVWKSTRPHGLLSFRASLHVELFFGVGFGRSQERTYMNVYIHTHTY